MIVIELDYMQCKSCVDTALARMTGGIVQGRNHATTYHAGFMERLGREIIGVAVGHPIDSAKDLTITEASNVIDILENDRETTNE